MCGIFGYVGKQDTAAQIVFNSLKSLEYRGYDSWGVGISSIPAQISKVKYRKSQNENVFSKSLGLNSSILIKKRTGKIGNEHVNDLPSSMMGFGHTRWATHGGITQTNAHPHLSCKGDLAIIHNGIVENYMELKKSLKLKHKFRSETDTEVILHLIEEFAHKNPLDVAVRKSFKQMIGLNAIVIMNPLNKQLIAARNGSPLVLGYGKGENFLASDALALLPYTKIVYFLEDNEMAVITDQKITVSQIKTGKIVKVKPQTLDWQIQKPNLGRYPHFMIKEIYEQPYIVNEIATQHESAQKVAQLMKKAYGTYLVGCGSAYYACIAGEYLFSKIAQRHVNTAVGSEFGYHLDFLTDKSLVLAISQSGETIDILESVKKAKIRGAQILALVNVLGSSLYRQAHEKVLIGAGPEIAVASTKALTGMVAHLISFAHAFVGHLISGKQVLNRSVSSMQNLLNARSIAKFKKLAKFLKNKEHIYCLGRGLSYPAALETALKIKEISYIHAEGMASGELKHGTLALVEKGTPVIAFLPNDETYGANLAGAMEMKARGAHIIGLSYKYHEVFDDFIHISDADVATIIPNIVAGQLLAYYLTLERGFDPDKPRNLAKSVTVK